MDNILSDEQFILDDFNPKSIIKNIANRVKARRIELNLTQQLLANKSGVSYGSVKRFETKHEISLKNLLMIAVVLNATDEFKLLFTQKQYKSIDDVIVKSKIRTRQRASKNEK